MLTLYRLKYLRYSTTVQMKATSRMIHMAAIKIIGYFTTLPCRYWLSVLRE